MGGGGGSIVLIGCFYCRTIKLSLWETKLRVVVICLWNKASGDSSRAFVSSFFNCRFSVQTLPRIVLVMVFPAYENRYYSGYVQFRLKHYAILFEIVPGCQQAEGVNHSGDFTCGLTDPNDIICHPDISHSRINIPSNLWEDN